MDTITEIQVTPMKTILLNELRIDLDNYQKVESTHPKNVFYYTSSEDGVTIQTRLRGDCETVISITYFHSEKDKNLRCGTLPQQKSAT